MTRKKQNRLLGWVVAVLVAFIALALLSKLNDRYSTLAKLYEFIKDTSLLIATVAVAHLANIYQKRQQFLLSLREQWREIVQAKAALVTYLNRTSPTLEDYLAACQQLSESIDNMRIVYSNVGETEDLIGLFPYAPLHHMRHVMERLDPRKGNPTAANIAHARSEIWTAFNAIREHFLDEFDIEEPTRPILVHEMKRMKTDGASRAAKRLHDRQLAIAGRNKPPSGD